ncbi:ABC transporter ATP-binding protein [Mesorhizobium sp. YR577]|uniref:ABC transporter ATP-binding protein n=1 Tax=Mesorhizobium sp. YR577 TaxID=1884373 RepID=UPI0008E521C9|nr:ABC transporter ATP-binding protein [Mesorhizobium sp. YR577]SFU23308.1 peptide/nickel transport system ATP-binding protein [Mesorhizobium sp. YR577]
MNTITTSPTLSVKDLRTSFRTRAGWVPIVKGVSFDIPASKTLAIVGESGSGKSVTALSIIRLLDTTKSRVEGSVKLRGRELLTLNKEDMRQVRGAQVGMIFQEAMTSLNPLNTIGRQIAESLKVHHRLEGAAAEAEAIRLLEKVQMPAAARRATEYPHNFSGGMRQRAMIAMALSCKPTLLIADEPTTALDVTVQAQILQLLGDLQREEGMSILFITHDMGVVAEIADRVLVLYQGNAIEAGETQDIFVNAQQPYTRSLIAAVPRLGTRTTSEPQYFPVFDSAKGEMLPSLAVSHQVDISAEPILKVRNLTRRFDIASSWFSGVTSRVHAVEDVSFDLRRGETLSLVGESGCGKSTTGRSLMRLIEPQSGSVELDGRNLLDLDARGMREARRDIQMIFQDPFASLDPRMTAGEAVAQPMVVHGLATRRQARAKAADLLQRVGLPADAADRFPQQFSGGQRQRICIARALSLEPRIIVADEAVSALDVSIKGQVVNLLLDLQRDMGLSYIFISHDMAVVERVSHRVAVMYLGEIVEIGPAGDIFANPQHPYTRSLIAAVPTPDPSLRGHGERLPVGDLKNPIRSADYVVPNREYRTISPGHVVQVWGKYWSEPVAA